MNGLLVQTTLYGKSVLAKIMKEGMLGENSEPLGDQPPSFEKKPLVFCSYFCEGYKEVYGGREGILFETNSPVVYACPADSFELMRGGNWLPGHEKFLFSSIKDMLKKYPRSEDFKKSFKKYFRKLTPAEIYPEQDRKFAERLYERDYCFNQEWTLGCNEITFTKPLKIKNFKIFNSVEELERLLC
jgi:hypothetical protein